MKHANHITRIAVALAAILFLSAGTAQAETRSPSVDLPPANFLTKHTLMYPSADGEEHLIHFGQFGTFDWYYPCTFETGSWALDGENVLTLTYDDRRRPDRRYTLSRRGENVFMTEPERTVVATLVPGNKLPHT